MSATSERADRIALAVDADGQFFEMRRRRSISDGEVALIKAMISRGMKNKDIQFFFNRPNRPVNTGRISTIASGSYSDSLEIDEASPQELDSFIASISSKRGGADTEFSPLPTFSDLVRALFTKGTDGRWRLASGENELQECKRQFEPKKLGPVVRAIAALSNNKGGYIFFGVSNKGYYVDGVGGAFMETDVVEIVERVKAHLSPTPRIEKGDIELDGNIVGFLRVERHPDRPIIVYRDGDGLNEGEILFRYPGQSARIKFGDLRGILEERDRRTQLALAGAAGKIADIGTANALILDTKRNVLETGGHSILIDEKLVEGIKFIKEGDFDERIGAPTLKLTGNVSAVPVGARIISRVSREALFQEQILEDFLNQENVDNPLQYIYAGLAQSRKWLPIFYFARLAKQSNEQLAEAVRVLKISQKGKKKTLIERLEGTQSAFSRAVSQAAKLVAAEIEIGTVSAPNEVTHVSPFAHGMTAVRVTKATLHQSLSALQACKKLAEAADDGNAMSAVFKAACRVDEIFFREGDKQNEGE